MSFDEKKEKNERCVSSLWLTIALTTSTSNSFLNHNKSLELPF